MNSNAVGWFEIYVQDMSRARSFYEAVFQVTLQELPSPVPEIAMVAFPMQPEAPGAPGALVHVEGVTPGGPGTLVYFSCADCAVEESRVVSAGGSVHRSKFPIGAYGHIALVRDTEGNLIGLHSQS